MYLFVNNKIAHFNMLSLVFSLRLLLANKSSLTEHCILMCNANPPQRVRVFFIFSLSFNLTKCRYRYDILFSNTRFTSLSPSCEYIYANF